MHMFFTLCNCFESPQLQTGINESTDKYNLNLFEQKKEGKDLDFRELVEMTIQQLVIIIVIYLIKA